MQRSDIDFAVLGSAIGEQTMEKVAFLWFGDKRSAARKAADQKYADKLHGMAEDVRSGKRMSVQDEVLNDMKNATNKEKEKGLAALKNFALKHKVGAGLAGAAALGGIGYGLSRLGRKD